MFKALGNQYQAINSIAEGAQKKRDARKYIALAEARARNAEQKDYTNQSAMIKVSGAATDKALENINLGASQAFSQASDAGIRGIGMMGKILQNVNDATQQQAERMADKEFAVQQAKAAEQSNLDAQKNAEISAQESRTDSMRERGEALRSQGSAEIGQGASQLGGAIDAGLKEGAKVVKGFATGGPMGAISAFSEDDGSKSLAEMNAPQGGGIPSNANTSFNPNFFKNFQQTRQQYIG